MSSISSSEAGLGAFFFFFLTCVVCGGLVAFDFAIGIIPRVSRSIGEVEEDGFGWFEDLAAVAAGGAVDVAAATSTRGFFLAADNAPAGGDADADFDFDGMGVDAGEARAELVGVTEAGGCLRLTPATETVVAAGLAMDAGAEGLDWAAGRAAGSPSSSSSSPSLP